MALVPSLLVKLKPRIPGHHIMAKNQTRRLSSQVVAQDKASLAALQDIDDYKPTNAAYKVADIAIADEAVDKDRTKETQLAADAKNARDHAVTSEWKLHNLILGAKKQVVAQYGEDSDEVQAVGLKKKSAYKTGGKKKVVTFNKAA